MILEEKKTKEEDGERLHKTSQCPVGRLMRDQPFSREHFPDRKRFCIKWSRTVWKYIHNAD